MANSQIVGVLRALLTADTAEFTAKMAAASGEVQDLAKALQRDLEPRQRAVNNAVRDFLGGNEIRKAEEFALAVEKIGGASKLTEADQKKVNRAVQDALGHYRALGMEVPAHLTKLDNETKQVTKSTSLLDQQWAKLTAAFGAGVLIDRAVSGLISFGKAAIEDASRVVDLSDKTGLSTRAIQVYGQVVKEAGGTVEGMASAVFKLGINIETGGKKIEQSLAAIGLGYAQVSDLKPEDQFRLIASALQHVDDVQQRNMIGVALFGKTYSEVAAAIASGIEDIENNMTVMGDAQIRTLDEMSDRWDRFWADTQRGTASFLGNFVMQTEQAASGWAKFIGDLLATSQGGLVGHMNYVDALRAQSAAAANHHDIQLAGTTKKLKELTAEEIAFGKAVDGVVERLSGTKIAEEIEKTAAAVKRLGASISAAELPALVKQIQAWHAEGRVLPTVLEKIRLEQESLNKALEGAFDFQDEIGHMQVASAWLDVLLRKKLDVSKIGPSVTLPAAPGTVEGFDQEMMNQALNAAFVFQNEIKKATDNITGTTEKYFSTTFPKVILGAIQGGGSVLNAAGASLGMQLLGPDSKFGQTIGKGVTGLFGKTLGGAINSLLPGVGALLGPLVGKIGSEIGKLFTNKGRDAVKDFADSMGGFDALHKQLGKLGDEGERLWVALTQGVGSDSPEQAKVAIDKIKDALARAESQAIETGKAIKTIGESGKSWQELQSLAQQFGIDITKLGTAFSQARIDDIAKEYKDAFDLFGKAGADVTAVLEGMQDEVNAWLKEALVAGVQIPESMRPILEAMAKAGFLTDAAGNKIEDLSGLDFAPTLEKGIDNLTQATWALVDVLGGEVPDAFQRLAVEAGRFTDEVGNQMSGLARRIHEDLGDLQFTMGMDADTSGLDVVDLPSFRNGSGGYRDFGAGTPAMLHGLEKVVPFGGGESGGGTVIMELNGRVLGTAILPHVVDGVRRMQLGR